MQREIVADNPATRIRIAGSNRIGAESGNDLMCDGRDLPWVQDTVDAQAWASWNVTYRDVVVLDEDNVPVAVYNLTEHSLSDPANYEELKAILLAAAGEQPPEPVPDFALLDVNTTSPTAGQLVSPRDYVGNISAWYHGAAT